jgi:hypothetical protein
MAWGMAFGSAAALFLVGPTALDASEEPGERARSTFILRGLSDAQTLLVFGFVAENVPGEEEHGMAWLIGGLLLIVGVFGMLRQASWGVALNMAVCSCLLVWSVFASFVPCGQSFNWPPFFFVLSLLELLAGTTMIFARFIGRPLPALVSANARRVLAYVGIALVLVLCICTQVVFPTIVRVGGRPPYGAFTAEWL